jgi:CBS domain-containing protein
MSTTVRQMIEQKRPIYSVAPEATVLDALRLLADRNVGALLVLDRDALVGVFSERDYARKVVLRGRTSTDTHVREVMSSHVVTVTPGQTAEDCMALMTDKRIRHLPVLDEGRLVGIVSIGDVVRAVLDEQRHTISSLVSYIGSGS